MTADGTPQRRICWPAFDCTCLEGGCGYCNGMPFRNISTIERAVHAGKAIPHHRGTGGKLYSPAEAFAWGMRHGWANAESRIYKKENAR